MSEVKTRRPGEKMWTMEWMGPSMRLPRLAINGSAKSGVE